MRRLKKASRRRQPAELDIRPQKTAVPWTAADELRRLANAAEGNMFQMGEPALGVVAVAVFVTECATNGPGLRGAGPTSFA